MLTDKGGRVRVFTIPAGWTGDLLADGVGVRTLDLASLAPQPGFASTATAFEDVGFAAYRVLSLALQLVRSGAMDDLTLFTDEQDVPRRRQTRLRTVVPEQR